MELNYNSIRKRVHGLMLRNLFVFICVMYPRLEGSVEIS